MDIALRSLCPKARTVTAGEARRLAGRAFELVDYLTFGQRDAAQRDCEADLLREELDLHLAAADLAGERMRAAETALRRVAQRKQETFVAARKILQPHVSLRGKRERLASQIAHCRVGCARRAAFDEPVAREQIGYRLHRSPIADRARGSATSVVPASI
jgi:hypothetical protein